VAAQKGKAQNKQQIAAVLLPKACAIGIVSDDFEMLETPALEAKKMINTVQEIQQAVSNLPANEFQRFREWFAEMETEIWDEQIESDIQTGKLDQFANEAVRQFKAGQYTEL